MSMSDPDLARELARVHSSAPDGEKTTYAVLFGIKHADDLNRGNIPRVLRMSGIRQLGPMLSVGRNLARYVDLKSA